MAEAVMVTHMVVGEEATEEMNAVAREIGLPGWFIIQCSTKRVIKYQLCYVTKTKLDSGKMIISQIFYREMKL